MVTVRCAPLARRDIDIEAVAARDAAGGIDEYRREAPAAPARENARAASPLHATRGGAFAPSFRCTSNFTAPTARLAANVSEDDMIPLCIRPRTSSSQFDSIDPPQSAIWRLISAGSSVLRSQVNLTAPRSITAKLSPRLAGKVEILFDQHDGHGAEAAQIGNGAADILDDRRLDAFGRLIQQQQLRPHHQRAADRQLLLLSARKIAATPSQHGLQHGEQREHIIGNIAVDALERTETCLEIFLHRQQRKYLAALRGRSRCPCARARKASAALDPRHRR